MDKINYFETEYCELIPNELENGKIYISLKYKRPNNSRNKNWSDFSPFILKVSEIIDHNLSGNRQLICKMKARVYIQLFFFCISCLEES